MIKLVSGSEGCGAQRIAFDCTNLVWWCSHEELGYCSAELRGLTTSERGRGGAAEVGKDLPVRALSKIGVAEFSSLWFKLGNFVSRRVAEGEDKCPR